MTLKSAGRPPEPIGRTFLAIAGAILIARLAFAFAFPIAQISDYSSYFQGAQILAGVKEGTLGSWDPIGPKLLYAIPVSVFGADVRVLGATNALLFVLGVFFLYRGACLAFDRATATLAALISLVSLSDLFFNNLAGTEVLAGLSLNLVFYLAARSSSPRNLAALGAVIGFAAYNRSNMVVMGAVVLVVEWFRTRQAGAALRRTALVQAVAVGAMLPLCAYNYSHFGRFTPVTSNSGVQVWYGNNPDAGPGSHAYARLPEEFPQGSKQRTELAAAYRSFFPQAGEGPLLTGADPYAFPDLGMRYALAWIRHNPTRYAEFSLARIRQMYEQCTYGVAPYLFYDPSLAEQPEWPDEFHSFLLGKGAHIRKPDGLPNPRSPLIRFVGRLYQVLVAGAALGLLATLIHVGVTRSRPERLLPGLLVLIYTAPFVLTIALNRYHVPAMGLLWTYLAHGLVQSLRLFGKGASSKATPGLSAGAHA